VSVIVIQFITLDGIVSDPDGSGGTPAGGWAFRHGPETVAGDWYYGCRCPICTKANAEKGRRYHGRSSRREAVPDMVTDVTATQNVSFQ